MELYYSSIPIFYFIIKSLKMQINALINNVPMSKSALLLVLWEVLILRVHVLQLCVKIEITNFKV